MKQREKKIEEKRVVASSMHKDHAPPPLATDDPTSTWNLCAAPRRLYSSKIVPKKPSTNLLQHEKPSGASFVHSLDLSSSV